MSAQVVRVLVLVPTRELGRQVVRMLRQLASHCARHARFADVSSSDDMSAQR